MQRSTSTSTLTAVPSRPRTVGKCQTKYSHITFSHDQNSVSKKYEKMCPSPIHRHATFSTVNLIILIVYCSIFKGDHSWAKILSGDVTNSGSLASASSTPIPRRNSPAIIFKNSVPSCCIVVELLLTFMASITASTPPVVRMCSHEASQWRAILARARVALAWTPKFVTSEAGAV